MDPVRSSMSACSTDATRVLTTPLRSATEMKADSATRAIFATIACVSAVTFTAAAVALEAPVFLLGALVSLVALAVIFPVKGWVFTYQDPGPNGVVIVERPWYRRVGSAMFRNSYVPERAAFRSNYQTHIPVATPKSRSRAEGHGGMPAAMVALDGLKRAGAPARGGVPARGEAPVRGGAPARGMPLTDNGRGHANVGTR